MITGRGAVFCGLVTGWISYRTLRLTAGTNLLAVIAIIIAVVGGAAVTALLKDEVLFGWYAIGLVIDFLASFALGLGLYSKQVLQLWRMPPALRLSPRQVLLLRMLVMEGEGRVVSCTTREQHVEGRESSVHRRGQSSPRERCVWWQTWRCSGSMSGRAEQRDGNATAYRAASPKKRGASLCSHRQTKTITSLLTPRTHTGATR